MLEMGSLGDSLNASSHCSAGEGPATQSVEHSAQDIAAFAAGICLLLFDIGWITSSPAVTLLGGILGMVLQAYVTAVAFQHDEVFVIALQLSMLLWIFGNIPWAFCDLLWPEPSGFLADIQFFIDLPPEYAGPTTLFSTYVVFSAVLVLMVVYLRLALRRSGYSRADSQNNGIVVVSSEGPVPVNQHAATVLHQTELSEAERSRFSQQWYRSIYVLFFLIADGIWCLANWFQIVGVSDGTLIALAILIAITGFIACVQGLRVVNFELKEKLHSNATLLFSDLLWVLGTVIWAVSDVLSDFGNEFIGTLFTNLALGVFVAAGVGMFASLCITNLDGASHASRIGLLSVRPSVLLSEVLHSSVRLSQQPV